jgi:hypothetical protein
MRVGDTAAILILIQYIVCRAKMYKAFIALRALERAVKGVPDAAILVLILSGVYRVQ